MENLLLNLGFSFTLSKALCYLVFILLGLVVTVIFNKTVKKTSVGKVQKLVIGIVLFILPFSSYFALNPIYEGDFSNNSYTVNSTTNFPRRKQLTIIALSNCPHCIQSVELTKILKKKNPAMKIEYWILSNNPIHQLKYQKLLGKTAKAKLKQANANELSILSKGSFPTFVLSENKKANKAWNNDAFGVVAMDKVCKEFN